VLGRTFLVDQALGNLMDNALKFGRDGVPIKINLRSEPGSSNGTAKWVRIFVEDNGVGIAPEYHERIFHIFERLSATGIGTGIGLAIVAKAVSKMGGHVGLVSTPGKGSTFWIELKSTEN
jgi:signal transduction histidine kinase